MFSAIAEKLVFFGDISRKVWRYLIFLGQCGKTVEFLTAKNHLLFSPKGFITDVSHGS